MLKRLTLNSLLLSLFILSSCANFGTRKPSSNDSMEFSVLVDQVRWATSLHLEDSATCKENYDQLYTKLFSLAGDSNFINLNDINVIDEEIKESFKARISLKESFKSFKNNNECLQSASDVFKALRYIEDYLIEVRMNLTQMASSEFVNLKGEFPYLLVNPKYEQDFKSYEDLKSGDVILSRGNAFSSAAIARIGNNDYQFSHLSFVYQGKKDDTLMTTEAHIEIGSVVEPLIEHINSKNAREAVFRYEDPDVAHLASKFIYDRVLENQTKKKNVEYDFSMNFRDDSRLFCSEIISSGFKKALPNEDFFPMFKTKFSVGLIPFLNTIGVPVNRDNIKDVEVFAPGDIQFDPRFELIAEWRNPKKMEESRLKDFILTKMFERMDKENYKIDASLKMEATSKSIWLLRRLPVVKRFLQKKIPINMNAGQIELFMAIDKVGDSIYRELEKISLRYDRPMTPIEIYTALDQIFSRDYETYKKYKKGNVSDIYGEVIVAEKPIFHQLFHP
ncbi:MAG: hypothetical protein HOP07_01465 [Bacteriovoracaceae bacterium]|nr:hypothetical protein [Bacteriovoracaceae bacterium]